MEDNVPKLHVRKGVNILNIYQTPTIQQQNNKQLNCKMVKGLEKTFLQRDKQMANSHMKKMYNITNHYRNTNQKYNEISTQAFKKYIK
jgi:hypothetical protein